MASLLPLCLLACSGALWAGPPPRIDDWVPLAWWTPVQSVAGKLNDDAFDDLAVVLERQQDAPEDAQFERGAMALLILFGSKQGRWRRGHLVPGMLPCTVCSSKLGGGQESALFDLSISADGILEIGWIQQRAGTKAVRLFIGWDASPPSAGAAGRRCGADPPRQPWPHPRSARLPSRDDVDRWRAAQHAAALHPDRAGVRRAVLILIDSTQAWRLDHAPTPATA
jgi:hypothetical protein